MTQDNLRHSQYDEAGIGIDDPQNLRRITDAQIASLISPTPVAWASRQSAAVAGSGAMMWTDLGTGVPPILMRSDGTYWKPVFRTTLLRKSILTSGLIQVGQQTIGQLGPLPAGVLYPGAIFGLRIGFGRDNNTDAYGATTDIRIGGSGGGAAGSAPVDTQVASLNMTSLFTAASGSLSTGLENWSVMVTATSCVRAGIGNAGASYNNQAGSGAALLSATTILNVTSNALYFTFTTNMGAATVTAPQTSYMDLILEP